MGARTGGTLPAMLIMVRLGGYVADSAALASPGDPLEERCWVRIAQTRPDGEKRIGRRWSQFWTASVS